MAISPPVPASAGGDAAPVAPTELDERVDGRFEQLVLDFLAYLEFERGLSRNTLEAYRSDLLQFGTFLEGRGRNALEVEHGDLAAFLAELATGDAERPSVSPAC